MLATIHVPTPRKLPTGLERLRSREPGEQASVLMAADAARPPPRHRRMTSLMLSPSPLTWPVDE